MEAEDKKQKFSMAVFREMARNTVRIFKMVWKEKKGLIIATAIFMLILSCMPTLTSWSIAMIINELTEIFGTGAADGRLLLFLVIFCVASLSEPMIMAFSNNKITLFYFFLEEKFNMAIIKKMALIDISQHEDPKKKDLINKVSSESTWRIQEFTERQFYLAKGFVKVALAAGIIFFFKWWIFLIILIGILPQFFVDIKYGQGVWGIWNSKAELKRRYVSTREHFSSISSIIELKLFQNTHYFLKTIRELFLEFQNEQKKNERRMLLNKLYSLVISQAATIFAFVWFVFEVVNGRMLVGTLTFALASVGNFQESLSYIFWVLSRNYQDSLFITDTFDFLDMPPALQQPKKGMALDKGKTPEIVFENVSFAYPGTDRLILENINLKIMPGEKIALVGINGAGKTTLIKLLCRFYDPTAGRILVGGYDLKDIDLESWYWQLGALFQDYDNYHFIVKEAIAVGRSGDKPSIEKVKDAAKAGEADIFIEEWENKYEQMLGREFTGGMEPSIGQWQKLALARAFYRDPRVLILDEPTSSIDAEAESKIFERLENLPSDRTVILISHRFSTVRQANRIAVIENGRIAELETHEGLLALNGIYARLFRLQAKGYK